MSRLVLAALLSVALSAPVLASTQLQTSVSRDLQRLGFHNVEVAQLTTSQLGAIHAIANGKGSTTRKRLSIRSIVGGRNRVRDLFR